MAMSPVRSKYWAPVENNSTLLAELEMIGAEKKVLEIGPGSGHMTEALTEHHCAVTCIEVNPMLQSKAASFCVRMIIGDVEHVDLDALLQHEQFDVILLGDVLEHLNDPQRVLGSLKRRLGLGGRLVASVPNVAHGSVRLSLLCGEFNYSDEGLLDQTHLRFYTLATIVALLRETGYQIRELRRTRVGIFNTEVKLCIDKVAVSVLKGLSRDPESTTYQFIFSAVSVSASVFAGSPEPSGPALTDVHWSARKETTRLARSLMRKGRESLHRNRCHEASAWFYRSLLLRPRVQVLPYLFRAWWGASLGSLLPRREQ